MPIAIKLPRPLPDEELERLSTLNPLVRFERGMRDELLVAPLPWTMESFGEFELSLQLAGWTRNDRRGMATSANTGFTLPDGSVFAPDSAWFSRERLNALAPKQRKGYAPLAPEVAFELLTHGENIEELRAKAGRYLAGGVKLVVLIDPGSRTIELHRPDMEPETHAFSADLAVGPELPGFVLDAEAIVRRMEDP